MICVIFVLCSLLCMFAKAIEKKGKKKKDLFEYDIELGVDREDFNDRGTL